MYKYTDYLTTYGRIMQFNKNKEEPVHRWYPFVEGYSKEFIKSIVTEVGDSNPICLEPFSGSGTTALELQNMGLKCISFEVNPLMYLVSRVKLYDSYDRDEAKEWYVTVLRQAEENTRKEVFSIFGTLYQNSENKKWNLDRDVAIAIENLKEAINGIENKVYSDLYMVALASILLEVSNLYRNGKCLSYKENWEETHLTKQEVFQKFSQKVTEQILPDIGLMQSRYGASSRATVRNYDFLYLGDSRSEIDKMVDDHSIDLVITSPPYLNSRDYTDTYMLELKALGFTKNFADITSLRNKTLRSHVQIKWKDDTTILNAHLEEILKKLETANKEKPGWNQSIIDMVRLYFVDIASIFSVLSKKVKTGGKVFFNVSNSAYYDILISTLDICGSIAEQSGFKVLEIRKARYMKTSPQQKESVKKLLEGVIVMEKVADE